MATQQSEFLRVDRWLWYSRIYKTRSLASAAVAGGHIRINGNRAKTSSRVRAGDVVDIRREQLQYELEILSLPSRRGPASEARATYQESSDSQNRRQEARDQLRADRRLMPTTDGKPDKHTRRKLRSRGRGQV